MRLYLRNKATSEIRDVEADSNEFRDLVKEVTAGGLPMWEQTSFPHADAIKTRAAHGELLEEDLGDEQKDELRYAALQLDLEGISPEANPHLALTPGEIEAGLTPGSKLKELQEMYDMNRVGARTAVLDKAADSIADERVDREQAQASKGQLARAGGSDDREDVPTVRAEDESDSSAPKQRRGKTARGQSDSPASQMEGGNEGGSEGGE